MLRSTIIKLKIIKFDYKICDYKIRTKFKKNTIIFYSNEIIEYSILYFLSIFFRYFFFFFFVHQKANPSIWQNVVQPKIGQLVSRAPNTSFDIEKIDKIAICFFERKRRGQDAADSWTLVGRGLSESNWFPTEEVSSFKIVTRRETKGQLFCPLFLYYQLSPRME